MEVGSISHYIHIDIPLYHHFERLNPTNFTTAHMNPAMEWGFESEDMPGLMGGFGVCHGMPQCCLKMGYNYPQIRAKKIEI